MAVIKGTDTADERFNRSTVTENLSGNDTISGGYGDDTIEPDTGNDLIYGDVLLDKPYKAGQDTGASGNLTIRNNTTDDLYLYGSYSNNGGIAFIGILKAGTTSTWPVGENSVRLVGNIDQSEYYSYAKIAGAGTQNQTYTIRSSNDFVQGSFGDDFVFGQIGADTVLGGDGDDQVFGGTGNDFVDGGTGNDSVSGDNGDDSVLGGIGDDTIAGGNGEDYILSGAGDDQVSGGGDDDSVFGGRGSDTITGDGGNDYIRGGEEDDSVLGSLGDDTIEGSDGKDLVYGGLGDDLLYGDVASDDTIPLTGDDTVDATLFGGDSDTIYAGDGNDSIYAGYGDDTVLAEIGSDWVDGGLNDDFIEGGVGDDTLSGGSGNDVIYGSSKTSEVDGPESFVVTTGAVKENDVTIYRQDSDFYMVPSNGSLFYVGDQPFVVTVKNGYDGWMDIYKVQPDGTLAPTDGMVYEDGSSNGGTPYIKLKANVDGNQTYLDGGQEYDIYPTLVAEGFTNVRMFGAALADTDVAEINGETTLFIGSENAAGITTWTVDDTGTLTFQKAIQFGNNQGGDGGTVADISVYQGSGGTYVYATRELYNLVTTFKYDPTSGFTKTGEIDLSSSGASRVDGMTNFSVDGNDYMAVSNGTGFQILSINPSTGALTTVSSQNNVVAPELLSGSNDVDVYTAADGTVYLTYSNTNAGEVFLYKVNANGTVALSDTLTGNGDYSSLDNTRYSYIDGEPVIVIPDEAGKAYRIFTISKEGTFDLKIEIADDKAGEQPMYVTTVPKTGTVPEGEDPNNYFLVNFQTGRTVELIITDPSGFEDDSIVGGDGDDTIFAQTGNDEIIAGGGDMVYGGDDRDVTTIDATQVGTGSTVTIDGGTGSTAPDDFDDFDSVVFGPGLTVVPGSFHPVVDEVANAEGNGASIKGSIELTDGTSTYLVNFFEIESIICFARGTMITSDSGDIPVEDLRVGDQVMTKDHGYKTIDWISSTVLSASMLEANPKLYPVRIKAGALGESYPQSDIYVSQQHRVLLKSRVAIRMFGVEEILVEAKHLVGIQGVDLVTEFDEVEYFHFLFDQHEIVFANGMQAESLFTGPEALKSVSPSAQKEILSLFPELEDREYVRQPARLIPQGAMRDKFVERHLNNNKPFFE